MTKIDKIFITYMLYQIYLKYYEKLSSMKSLTDKDRIIAMKNFQKVGEYNAYSYLR